MSSSPPASGLARRRAQLSDWWKGQRQQHYWLDHVVIAWQRFQRNNGSQFAAAITYFSFLALFPLLLLAIAITGFVLTSHKHLQLELFQKITDNVPGSFGQQISSSVQTLIDARTSVGIIGLVGVLLTGLGWIGNLRQAVNAVWGTTPAKRNFVMSRLANLFVLAGLGIGAVLSIGLTAVGTSLTDQLVKVIGLSHVTGMGTLVRILGIGLAVFGDMIIFSWVLIRLPKGRLPRPVALRAVLMAAIGFEILKFAGTYTIAKSAQSPTAGPFAGVIAVLVWVQLVSRWLLFCTAWSATARGAGVPETAVPLYAVPVDDASPSSEVAEPESGASPAAVAVGLLGVGAAAGAGAAVWYARRRDSPSSSSD